MRKKTSKGRPVDPRTPVALEDGKLGPAAGGRANEVVDRLVKANLDTAARTSSAICRTCRWCYVGW